MTKLDFEKLLERYVQGNCTAEEIRQVDQWYSSIAAEEAGRITEQEKQAIHDRMWSRITQTVAPSPLEEVKPEDQSSGARRLYLYWAGAAAALILILNMLWNRVPSQEVAERPAVEQAPVFKDRESIRHIRNSTDKDRLFTLEDKSTILLSPGSSLSFPVPFSKSRREVELVGNAFFDITRNLEKPFYVYCGGAVTQVVGTSFWVKTESKGIKCQAVEVEVKTGKVSVYGHSSKPSGRLSDPMLYKLQGVILTPNQKVVFFPDNNHLIPGLVDQPALITPAKLTPSFIYNDTPLTQVFSGLEKGYGIEIIRATDKLDSCSFSGDLSDLSLDDKLTLVCKSVGACYEVRGTRILVNGSGCNL